MTDTAAEALQAQYDDAKESNSVDALFAVVNSCA